MKKKMLNLIGLTTNLISGLRKQGVQMLHVVKIPAKALIVSSF